MAAKNHALIMPDCDKEETLNALVGAAFGAGGQRCMALSVVVFVGESKNWIPDIAKKAQSLTLGHGKENVDISPLCYSDLKNRVVGILDTVEKEGGKFHLDGRNYVNSKYP